MLHHTMMPSQLQNDNENMHIMNFVIDMILCLMD